MEKYCIINSEAKAVAKIIEDYGYKCIFTEKSGNVSDPISLHADVLYLKSDNTVYVSDCQKRNIELIKAMGYRVEKVNLSPGYKTESRLNVVVTDDLVLCNPKTSIDIAKIAQDRQIIVTKQGYTRCSTIVVDDNNFITEDININDSLINAGKNCLLIEKGHIKLKGYEYGFIGGAAVVLDNRTIVFSGDISNHPDYNKIKYFCENINTNIVFVKEYSITDFGGAVFL